MAEDLITEREETFGRYNTVRIAALTVKVNWWTRLILGLGLPPAGYLETCSLPKDFIW